MRSGQYKISGSGSKGTVGYDGAVPGQFRSSSMEVPISDSPIPEFPHMNSLVVTMNKMTDSRPLNKSCENLSGPRGAVNRVEQRVKSFLQRGEARLRQGEDANSPVPSEDGWQYGHVVTLPRRPRLSLALSHSALNHLSTSDTASCLSASSGYSSSSSSSYGSFKSSASSNCSTLPRKKKSSEEQVSPSTSRSCTFVDNPMYDITPGTDPRSYHLANPLKRRGSPSPGHDPIYDFTPATDPRNRNLKSHRRRSASVPRHEPVYDITPDIDLQHFDHNKTATRRGSVPVNEPIYDETPDSDPLHCSYSSSPCHQSSPNLRNDPIYDTIPGSESYSPYRQSPTQGHEHLYDVARPSRLLTPDSGTHGGLDSLEESALDSLDCSDPQTVISESDETKEDQVAKECREYFEKRLKNSETLKKRWSMCSSDSGADSGDSEMSTICSSASAAGLSIVTCNSASKVISSGLPSCSEPKEKGSSKKTPLDQKMEFLRKEIASLMKQDNQLFKQLLTLHESISALKCNPPHPHRPPSPASLDSFTEEEEEEEEEPDEEGEKEDIERQKRMEKEAEVEDNLSDVDEGLETDHSLTHSISPTSTLSSKSSRDSTLSSKSCRDSTLSSKSSRDSNFSKDSHFSAAEATSPESSPIQSTRPPPSPFQRAVSSPSPQSSQCSQSSAFSSNAGTLAFMRSRKSYAPNARNRRRSSSAHLLVRPDLETISTRHENEHELNLSTVEVPFSSDEVSDPRIAGGSMSRASCIPQMTSSLRESSPAQRSLSLSSNARENLQGKTMGQDIDSLGSGGGQGTASSSNSSLSSSTTIQRSEQHPTRPRSSSAILSAAKYPSVPSSRPLNYPVFREALIM